jgi:multidrug resistance efflux pump
MSRIWLLSFPLVGVAAMIIASESVAQTSVAAVIDAPLATIRAPIQGTLTLAKSRLGSSVSQGEPLGEIANSRAEGTRLPDLERTKTDLTAELAKIEQSLATSKGTHADFAASASRYQEGRILQFTARLNQEQGRLEAANARLVDLNNTFVRANTLSGRGIQTVANPDHARSGSFRMWLRDPSPNGARLCGIKADEPAFCSTLN